MPLNDDTACAGQIAAGTCRPASGCLGQEPHQGKAEHISGLGIAAVTSVIFDSLALSSPRFSLGAPGAVASAKGPRLPLASDKSISTFRPDYTPYFHGFALQLNPVVPHRRAEAAQLSADAAALST